MDGKKLVDALRYASCVADRCAAGNSGFLAGSHKCGGACPTVDHSGPEWTAINRLVEEAVEAGIEAGYRKAHEDALRGIWADEVRFHGPWWPLEATTWERGDTVCRHCDKFFHIPVYTDGSRGHEYQTCMCEKVADPRRLRRRVEDRLRKATPSEVALVAAILGLDIE